MIDDLRQPSTARGDHGAAAAERFYRDESERLWLIARNNHRVDIVQQLKDRPHLPDHLDGFRVAQTGYKRGYVHTLPKFGRRTRDDQDAWRDFERIPCLQQGPVPLARAPPARN